MHPRTWVAAAAALLLVASAGCVTVDGRLGAHGAGHCVARGGPDGGSVACGDCAAEGGASGGSARCGDCDADGGPTGGSAGCRSGAGGSIRVGP